MPLVIHKKEATELIGFFPKSRRGVKRAERKKLRWQSRVAASTAERIQLDESADPTMELE